MDLISLMILEGQPGTLSADDRPSLRLWRMHMRYCYVPQTLTATRVFLAATGKTLGPTTESRRDCGQGRLNGRVAQKSPASACRRAQESISHKPPARGAES